MVWYPRSCFIEKETRAISNSWTSAPEKGLFIEYKTLNKIFLCYGSILMHPSIWSLNFPSPSSRQLTSMSRAWGIWTLPGWGGVSDPEVSGLYNYISSHKVPLFQILTLEIIFDNLPMVCSASGFLSTLLLVLPRHRVCHWLTIW